MGARGKLKNITPKVVDILADGMNSDQRSTLFNMLMTERERQGFIWVDCEKFSKAGIDVLPDEPDANEHGSGSKPFRNENNIGDPPPFVDDGYVPFGSAVHTNRLISLSEIMANMRGANWLIYPFLETDSLGVLFGETGAKKSFLAIDLALCVAFGKDFHGHKVVNSGPVIYVAGEGGNGVSKRIKAWMIKNDLVDQDAPFFRTELPIRMMEDCNVAAMAELVKANGITPSLIIVDTLSTNMGGGNESDNNDISKALLSLSVHLREWSKACVLVVHHTGHGDKGRERGASALRCNTDFSSMVSTSPDGEMVIWECKKMKDHKLFDPLAFKADVVSIPGLLDNVGHQETSIVLSIADYCHSQSDELPHKQSAIIGILKKELEYRAMRKKDRGDSDNVAFVPIEELAKMLVSEACYSRIFSAKRAIEVLVLKKQIESDGHNAWL